MNESEPSEQIRLTGWRDYNTTIVSAQRRVLDSGFCDHSSGFGAGWLRNEHASSDIRHNSKPKEARRITRRAQHILALAEAKLNSIHRENGS